MTRDTERPLIQPETLQECLAPLITAAVESSVLAHQWGIANGSLMRASAAMDLAAQVIDRCKALIALETQ